MSGALVIDDLPEDRLAIADALSRAGLSVYLSDGDPRHMPSVTGVRVIVLDLQLLPGRFDDATLVSSAVGILESIVPENNGPFVVLLWSTREELLPRLEAALKGTAQPPVAVTSLNKSSAKGDDGQYRGDDILGRIFGSLADQHAVQLLLGWEEVVDRAASTTAATVIRSGSGANSVLAHLVLQSMPDTDLQTPSTFPSAFVRALSPLLYDEIVGAEITGKQVEEALASITAPRPAKLKVAEAADLNARIHLDRQSSPVRPGNLYHLPGIRKRVSGSCPSASDLVGEMRKKGKDLDVGDVLPILIELTPSCDFYQGHLRTGRLIAGLLIPPRKDEAVSDSPAFRRLPVMDFSRFGLDATWLPVLNARRLVSIQGAVLAKEVAVCRIRDELMSDVRSWATGQANRVGILSMRA